MKQTCYLKPVVNALNALNDMLWFNRFNGHEAMGLMMAMSGEKPEGLTGECFPGNPFAARFNVRLKEVGRHGAMHDEMLFRVVYGCSYEYFSRHRKRMLELLESCGGKPWISPRKSGSEAPEERFDRALRSCGYRRMRHRHKVSAAYARVRRNQYFHAADATWGKMAGILASSGARLNQLWSRQPAVDRVDFTSDGLSGCSTEEAIGLLRLLLILTKEIDAHTVALLDQDKLVEHSLALWTEEEKSRRLAGGRGRVTRMVVRLRDELGIRRGRGDVEMLLVRNRGLP